jgi:hypothetical protein
VYQIVDGRSMIFEKLNTVVERAIKARSKVWHTDLLSVLTHHNMRYLSVRKLENRNIV